MKNQNILEWSRKIVNELITANNSLTYLYTVSFIIEPNPLDYDGCDSVSILILEINQKTKAVKQYFKTEKYLSSIDEAVKETEDFLKNRKKV